ncbi:hypothetical protein NGRA_1001 [Nosema granulosis]|uniref:Uncharacterized protein n=1 Tax=Nosema granulosis TaxID=83296 RepID=A0A9P6KZS8_9MICR|nr:hypothetical protein NGRA_1001 [Nosema granulosis]
MNQLRRCLNLLEEKSYLEITKLESKNPVILSIKTLAYAKLKNYKKCKELANSLVPNTIRGHSFYFPHLVEAMKEMEEEFNTDIIYSREFTKDFSKTYKITKRKVFYSLDLIALTLWVPNDIHFIHAKIVKYDRIDLLLILIHSEEHSLFFLNILLDVVLELDEFGEIYDKKRVVAEISGKRCVGELANKFRTFLNY